MAFLLNILAELAIFHYFKVSEKFPQPRSNPCSFQKLKILMTISL